MNASTRNKGSDLSDSSDSDRANNFEVTCNIVPDHLMLSHINCFVSNHPLCCVFFVYVFFATKILLIIINIMQRD